MGNQRPHPDGEPNSAVLLKGGRIVKTLLLLVLALPLAGDISRSPGGAACSSHPCTLAVTCRTSMCSASDIQAAINEAQLGDTITIQAGVAWTVSSSLILYRKSAGSGVLTIRTSTPDAQLPASGVRILPAYKSLLPELRITSTGGSAMMVEQTSNAVEDYTFIGIWFSVAQGVDSNSDMVRLWVASATPEVQTTITGASNTSPVTLTMSSTSGLSAGDHVMVYGATGNTGANGWWTVSNIAATTLDLNGSVGNGTFAGSTNLLKTAQWDASQTPNNIIFDRCLFLADPLSTARQAVRAAGRNITIENSYCDQIKAQTDAQCISMPATPGPVNITNNWFGGGAAENIVSGGVIPNLPNQYATDVTVTHNAFSKDPALYKYETWPSGAWVREGKIIDGGNGYHYIAVTSGTTGVSAPTFPTISCPSPPTKSPGCWVVDGTVTWERNWFPNSDFWTVKNLVEFKTANRVTIRWNTLDDCWPAAQTGTGFTLKADNQGSAGDWTAHTEHVEFGNNVVRNVTTFAEMTSGGDSKIGVTNDWNVHDNLSYLGVAFQGNPFWRLYGRPDPYLSSLVVNHNTVDRGANNYGFFYIGTSANLLSSPVFTNNLFEFGDTAYPMVCSTCPGTSYDKAALDAVSAWSSYTFSTNVLSGETLSSWPTGNFNTAWSSIGFTDAAHGNYTLTNASPYHNAGTDGKDLGADTTQLPLISGLTVTPSATGATLGWSVTDPIEDIPCVIEASTSRDLATTIADLDPTVYTRPEVVAIGGTLARSKVLGSRSALTPGATYWYRLHCGGAFEQGSFTTQAISPRGVFGRGTVTGRGVVR